MADKKKTRTWMVTGAIKISVTTRVLAESEEEAVGTAADRSIMGLCHRCAGSEGDDQEWRTSGELDGEVGYETISAKEIKRANESTSTRRPSSALLRLGPLRIRPARESRDIITAARAACNDAADFAVERPRTQEEIAADLEARKVMGSRRSGKSGRRDRGDRKWDDFGLRRGR